MKDQSFSIYHSEGVYFSGDIYNNCLSLTSEVYGGGFSSERHYTFTREETRKLFRIITLDQFIKLCQREQLTGMEDFLNEHNIKCSCVTI